MPDTTACLRLQFPLDTDPINVAKDIETLADDVDDQLCGIKTDVDDLKDQMPLRVRIAGDTMSGGLQINTPSTGVPLILRRSGGGPYMLFDTFPTGTDLGLIQGNTTNMLYRASPTSSAHVWQIGTTEVMRLSPGGILDVNQVRTDVRATFGAPSGRQIYIVDTQAVAAAPTASIIWFTAGTVAAPTTEAMWMGYLGSQVFRLSSRIANWGIQLDTAGTGNIVLTNSGTGDIIIDAGDDIVFQTGSGTIGVFNADIFLIGKSASDVLQPGVEIDGSASGEGQIYSTINQAGGSNLKTRHRGAASADNQYFLACYNDAGTNIGGIRQSGTAVQLVGTATSDYRVKDVRGPVEDALDRLMRLRPVRFVRTDTGDGVVREGLIAHEVAEVAPYAVVGDKDAVDDDGAPQLQDMHGDQLVGLLVGAIQELNRVVVELIVDNRELAAHLRSIEERCCDGKV